MLLECKIRAQTRYPMLPMEHSMGDRFYDRCPELLYTVVNQAKKRIGPSRTPDGKPRLRSTSVTRILWSCSHCCQCKINRDTIQVFKNSLGCLDNIHIREAAERSADCKGNERNSTFICPSNEGRGRAPECQGIQRSRRNIEIRVRC